MNNVCARFLIYIDLIFSAGLSIYPITALFWRIRLSKGELFFLILMIPLILIHLLERSDYLVFIKATLCFLSYKLGQSICGSYSHKTNNILLFIIFLLMSLSVLNNDFSISNRFVFITQFNPNSLAVVLFTIIVINSFRRSTFKLLPFIALTVSRSIIGPIIFSVILRKIFKKNIHIIILFIFVASSLIYLVWTNPFFGLILGNRIVYVGSALYGLEFSLIGFGSGASFSVLEVGYENFKLLLPSSLEYFDSAFEKHRQKNAIDPHNSFITVFSDYGLIGFSLYFYAFCIFFKNTIFISSNKFLGLVTFLVFFIAASTHNLVFSRELFLSMGYLSAIVINKKHKST
jgi:hypothetical protein